MRWVTLPMALWVAAGCVPAGGSGDDAEPEPPLMLPDAGGVLCDPSIPGVYSRDQLGPCPSYEAEVERWGLKDGNDPCPEQANRNLRVGVRDPDLQRCPLGSECGSTALPWYYCGVFPLAIPDPDGNAAAYTRDPGRESIRCSDGWPLVHSIEAGCALAIYADCSQPNLAEWRARIDVLTCDEI